MTIKRKLQLLMLATLIGMCAGIAVAVIGFSAVHGAYRESVRRSTELQGLTEINASVSFAVRLDPNSEYTEKRFADADSAIRRWTATLAPLLATGEKSAALKTFALQWDDYSKKLQRVFQSASSDHQSASAQAVDLFHTAYEPMHSVIAKLAAQVNRSEKEGAAQTETTIVTAGSVVAGVLLLVMVLVVGWLFFIARQIVKSTSELQQSLQHISENLDLDKRAVVRGSDEIALAAVAFNQLMERIAAIVLAVRESAALVKAASSEIASGNIDLSSRTEQQAAALEQTAASMEQLTGSVRHNADNADQAASLASAASDTASRGNEVVSRAAETMEQVSTSATKIAAITGMIEGIAFQTNILALNAAVEAARAGEQGRGFAVVAGEVRSLAQRASSAAKEIKALIDVSVTTSAQGSELVFRAGGMMTEITGAVARVAHLIGEIARAAGEQSRGIDEVAEAVAQMDRATQQNAALVEQAAAAAQSMHEQAARLDGAVGEFRVDGDSRLSVRS